MNKTINNLKQSYWESKEQLRRFKNLGAKLGIDWNKLQDNELRLNDTISKEGIVFVIAQKDAEWRQQRGRTTIAYILKASPTTPTGPQQNLNFPQICPNMPQNAQKWPKNYPKWPKITQNGPNMTPGFTSFYRNFFLLKKRFLKLFRFYNV